MIIKKNRFYTIDGENMSENYPNTNNYVKIEEKDVIHIIQEDEATINNHNDCWSDITHLKRGYNYSSLINNSNETYLPHLLNSENQRLKLPSSEFTLEFDFISNNNTNLRFANLKGEYEDIHLYYLDLKKGDKVKINYIYGIFNIFKNNQFIEEKKFKIIEDKGYFTWRIPSNSSVEFSNFRVYKTSSPLINIIDNNLKLESQIKSLEKEIDDYKKKNEEILESTNFLLNTIFLDYELKPKNLMKDIQLLCTELLTFVGNVCKKHNLDWWLDYGTLIGAVRHQDFIPWDDDIDISMMRKDYNKLNEIIFKEIENYGLDDLISITYKKRVIDGKSVNGFIQLFIVHEVESRNKIFAGVDIFPYDYLKGYDEKTLEDKYEESKNSFYRYLTNGSEAKMLYMGLNQDSVMEHYLKTFNYDLNDGNYIIPGVEGACGPNNLYNLMILKKNDVFPLQNKKYADKIFPCPNNPDSLLRSVYGKYMEVPSIIRTHGRVNKFRYYPGIEEVFIKDYHRLKEVNNQFEKLF